MFFFPLTITVKTCFPLVFFFVFFCSLCWQVRKWASYSFSYTPQHIAQLFKDTGALHVPVFGDLSLLCFKVKAHSETAWQTSLCRLCIVSVTLESFSTVRYFTFQLPLNNSRTAFNFTELSNNAFPCHPCDRVKGRSSWRLQLCRTVRKNKIG